MACDLDNALAVGCRALDIPIDPLQLEQLLTYLQLLKKWNGAYNLTAVRDPAAMVTRHLLDSLAIVPHLPTGHCLDVGTGAGLPGIPLAILFPEREFHLLDSNGKKIRFLVAVKSALQLANVTIHNARVEAFSADTRFDVILSRAFASLEDMVAGTRHLLGPGGHFLAMKGAYPHDELVSVAQECLVHGVYPLTVPGLNEQRHLVDLALRQSPQ